MKKSYGLFEDKIVDIFYCYLELTVELLACLYILELGVEIYCLTFSWQSYWDNILFFIIYLFFLDILDQNNHMSFHFLQIIRKEVDDVVFIRIVIDQKIAITSWQIFLIVSCGWIQPDSCLRSCNYECHMDERVFHKW